MLIGSKGNGERVEEQTGRATGPTTASRTAEILLISAWVSGFSASLACCLVLSAPSSLRRLPMRYVGSWDSPPSDPQLNQIMVHEGPTVAPAQVAFIPPTKWEGETVGRFAFLHPDTSLELVREVLARTT
jgi:hypothetical protein